MRGNIGVFRRPQAGPVTLEWMDAAGKPASQKVVVLKPLTRVTLS